MRPIGWGPLTQRLLFVIRSKSEPGLQAKKFKCSTAWFLLMPRPGRAGGRASRPDGRIAACPAAARGPFQLGTRQIEPVGVDTSPVELHSPLPQQGRRASLLEIPKAPAISAGMCTAPSSPFAPRRSRPGAPRASPRAPRAAHAPIEGGLGGLGGGRVVEALDEPTRQRPLGLDRRGLGRLLLTQQQLVVEAGRPSRGCSSPCRSISSGGSVTPT